MINKITLMLIAIAMLASLSVGGYFGYQKGYADGRWAGSGDGVDSIFKLLGYEKKTDQTVTSPTKAIR